MTALDIYRPLAFEVEHFAQQDALNQRIGMRIGHPVFTPDAGAWLVRQIAERAHAEYPQYVGHWDGWKLVRFGRDVTTKGGLRFAIGDYAIADMTPPALPFCHDGSVTAYSVRGAVNVRVGRGDFEVAA